MVEAEYTALAAIFQSVLADAKQSQSSWDTVAGRAAKLATCLKSTAHAFAAFVDSVQHVADLANNLKGASRDIGACVTRLCMRQRAVDARFRSMADALSEEVCINLASSARSSRARLSDLERRGDKLLKRSRKPKDATSLVEHRRLCTQVLIEQRSLMTSFVNAIAPFTNAEMALLDEGAHVRQVVESTDSTMRHVDPSMLVNTILSDLTQGSENAWRQCLAAANRSFSQECLQEDRRGLSSPSSSNFDPSPAASGNPASAVFAPASSYEERPVVFREPRRFDVSANSTLQRQSENNWLHKTSSYEPQRVSSARASNQDLTMETFAGCQLNRRGSRPSSFAGPAFPLPPELCRKPVSSTSATSSSPMSPSDSENNALLEALQQIDQLGSDLDAYCEKVSPRGTVRTRTSSTSSSRPPPPERKGSAITSNHAPPRPYNDVPTSRPSIFNFGVETRPPPPPTAPTSIPKNNGIRDPKLFRNVNPYADTHL